MPKALANNEIAGRLHDYARNNYLFLGNVTKGVVLAIATSILLQMLSDFRSEWVIVTPWLASFIGILVTYMTSLPSKLARSGWTGIENIGANEAIDALEKTGWALKNRTIALRNE